jgi:hypothetical protein
LAETNNYFIGLGYITSNQPTNNCVVAYGTTSSVGHFARIDNGIVTAKNGDMELIQHPQADIYASTAIYGGYGSPVIYYIKS